MSTTRFLVAFVSMLALATAAQTLRAQPRRVTPRRVAPRPATPPRPAAPSPVAKRNAEEVKMLKAKLRALTKQMQRLQAELQRRGKTGDAAANAARKKLEMKVEILTEEVQKLRERLVLPEKEKDKSVFGLGPAASKVYLLKKPGLSIGGYGEFYLDRKLKDKNAGKDFSSGDVYRYIQYIGFKFTDWLVMNAEIEFEHTTTSKNFEGKAGSISVEFVYLDLLPKPYANLRFGLMLVPMGFINEIHEPPFYHGNLRPEVERQIIPSTWRELGVMYFGRYKGVTWKIWAMNGLNAGDPDDPKFSPNGWRSGRQKGGRVLSEDWGGGVRIDYVWKNILLIGASVFVGEADHGRISDANGKITARTILFEGHAQFRYKGFELRALGAFASLSNSARLTLALYPPDPAEPVTDLLASEMYGYYVEVAFDFWRFIKTKQQMYFAPFVRFENYNTQASVPAITGRSQDTTLNRFIVDVGLTFKPIPQVVVKLNYRETWNQAGNSVAKNVDALYLGAGFIY